MGRYLVEKSPRLFVPTGYSAWIVGNSEEDSFVILLPLLSKPLFVQCKKVVKSMVRNTTTKTVTEQSDVPWCAAVGANLQLWLQRIRFLPCPAICMNASF